MPRMLVTCWSMWCTLVMPPRSIASLRRGVAGDEDAEDRREASVLRGCVVILGCRGRSGGSQPRERWGRGFAGSAQPSVGPTTSTSAAAWSCHQHGEASPFLAAELVPGP